MAIFIAKRVSDANVGSFRVSDSDGRSIPSCDDFLLHLRLRDCSVYTQRAYALGLAHFFSWLNDASESPERASRQVISRYISEFSQSERQGAVASRSANEVRSPRTINHRLSVLASYFDFHIRRDTEDGSGPWCGRVNPASGKLLDQELRHSMVGRDLPPRTRQRDGFRRRVPYEVPKRLEPTEIQKLIDTASSFRDKAILTLLCRTGQRVGDWSTSAGRHGILGMSLSDIDRKRRLIAVRLKGARDEHRVPVTDDFWPVYERYLKDERRAFPNGQSLWVALRKGRGKPLTYASFESSLRYISRKACVPVHPHLFRHTLAQGVLDLTGNLKIAQELLGHAHISTTGDLYTRVDAPALVKAVAAVKASFAVDTSPSLPQGQEPRYAFPYDADTIAELEHSITRPALPTPSPARRPRK
jgi:site-specific recombinase XerD